MGSNDDASKKADEARTWEGRLGTFTVETPARGVVVLRITGHDVGEFGQAPMQELERHLIDRHQTELFIDARSTDTVSVDVSGDWARWLGAHRSYWTRIRMLTGSRFVQVTADFVRRFADLRDIMQTYSDPAEFDEVLATSIASAKARSRSA